MEIVKMTVKDMDEVLSMEREFFASPALLHPLDDETIKRTVRAACGGCSGFCGYLMKSGGETAGFGHISRYFESEVGGECVLLMDIYVKPEFRGQGIGSEYIRKITELYPEAKRFRLEAEPGNSRAIAMYERLGFRTLGYKQMCIDKE